MLLVLWEVWSVESMWSARLERCCILVCVSCVCVIFIQYCLSSCPSHFVNSLLYKYKTFDIHSPCIKPADINDNTKHPDTAVTWTHHWNTCPEYKRRQERAFICQSSTRMLLMYKWSKQWLITFVGMHLDNLVSTGKLEMYVWYLPFFVRDSWMYESIS